MDIYCSLMIQMILYWNALYGCSPGPRYGYRQSAKKFTPLVRGQFIPHLSETTIGASGPGEGPITPNSPNYHKLLDYFNPSVIFKDSRRKGNTRLMTQRCSDRVDTLALLVSNVWPNMLLRVTKAWKIDGENDGSLHKEGRAIDFTTSDKDKKKYGLLARLAVEAGFDWVEYKSKNYVHASVRSDNSDTSKFGGCFPAESFAFSDGFNPIPLHEISVGDKVLATDRHTGKLVFSDVTMIMDRQINVTAEFVQLTTFTTRVTLTKNHILFVLDRFYEPRFALTSINRDNLLALSQLVHAGDVSVGDFIFTQECLPLDNCTGSLLPSRVLSIKRVVRKGVIAPLTLHGTIIVDNVASSCYSSFFSESLAHAAFFPTRLFNFTKLSVPSVDGLHWYPRLLSKIATFLFPSFFRFV